MRIAYRVWQFWQALTARPPAEAPAELGPGLRELYKAMPRADRAHAQRTARALRASSPLPVPRDLIVAALLHDVGKSERGISLRDRVLYVLIDRCAPRQLDRCSGGLAALRDHAELGARRVAEAGAGAEVVELIRRHHADPAQLPWPEARRARLAALQRADEVS